MTKKVIGIDAGYGYTKVVTDVKGTVVPLSFPSMVSTYEEGIEIEGLRVSEENIVKTLKQRFLVGAGADKHGSRALNMRDRSWIDSAAYKALLLHALRIAEANAVSLEVVTGLPVRYFISDKDKLVNIIRDVACDFCINCSVKVIPQPLGSFFNLLFNEQGEIIGGPLANEKVGILDIGFYTTDLITVSELEFIAKKADSFENGVSTALDLIAKDIENLYGMRPNPHKTEVAVKDGFIKVAGEGKDIRALVKKRFRELAQEIEAQARTVWKGAGDLDRVVLTGGGAAALKDYLALYSHAAVIDSAQYANALGYYKLGKRMGK